MLKLLTGPLGLLLVAAILWWGLTFNTRLEERHCCTACTFQGLAGGIAGFFCWALAFGALGGGWERWAAGLLALSITLALFFSNRAKSGSTLLGVLMTVWQLFVGLTVFCILEMLKPGRKKRK